MPTVQAANNHSKQTTPTKPTTKTTTKPTAREVATRKALDDLGIVTEWNTHKELKSRKFGDLCEQMALLKAEIALREEKLSAIKDSIDIALACAGTEKVIWEDRPVQRITKCGAARIDGQKLVEKGVDPVLVASCTVPGKEYSYIDMGKVIKSRVEGRE